MTGRGILFGIFGLIIVFALMLWNGWFMHGDPVEPPQETELTN